MRLRAAYPAIPSLLLLVFLAACDTGRQSESDSHATYVQTLVSLPGEAIGSGNPLGCHGRDALRWIGHFRQRWQQKGFAIYWWAI